MNASLEMSLRDWFAGLAMQGIMAHDPLDYFREDAAEVAYKMADAMLAEREKSHEEGEGSEG